jgi:hypothetical protein
MRRSDAIPGPPGIASGDTAAKGSGRGPPTGIALFPAERAKPQRYLTPSSRDWFAWLLR